MVREVEVKYRVTDPAEVQTALWRGHGVVLGASVRQDDQAYAPAGWSYGDPRQGVPFARLRSVDGRHTFTVKRPADNVLSCLEVETEVADREAMHQAVLAMGYRATVRITKTRRTTVVGETTVCLDEVDELGGFLEMERRVPDSERGERVQDQLAAFVAQLGVDAVRTCETYDTLVRAEAPTMVGT